MGNMDNIDIAIEQDIQREEAEAKLKALEPEEEKPTGRPAGSKRLVKKITSFNRTALRKLKAQDVEVVKSRGVLYLGHIPDGFHEKEMAEYFAQFGEVYRIRLSRSRKTGGSRGYAFIEFENKEVAEIVAETMNGYRMFKKTLQAKVVPQEKVHERIWHGRNIPKDGFIKSRRHHFSQKMKELIKPSALKLQSVISKEKKLNEKLAEMGIDYSFTKLTSGEGKSKVDAMVETAKEHYLGRQLAAEKYLEDLKKAGPQEKKAPVSAKKRKQEKKEAWLAKAGETAEEKADRKVEEKAAKKEHFKEQAADAYATEKATKKSQNKEEEDKEAAKNKLAVLEAVLEAKEKKTEKKKAGKKTVKGDQKKKAATK